MARIEGLEASQAGLFGRIAYWMTKRKIGKVIGPIKITAHHPRLLRAMGSMEMGQAAACTVPEPFKILASIKVASLVGCPF